MVGGQVTRQCAMVLLFLPLLLQAQPGWPSFCFVLAEQDQASLPLEGRAEVVQHYRVRMPYWGMDTSWLKPESTITLSSGPLFRGGDGWQVFEPLEGMAESYVLAIAGKDTMRINLPEDMTALVQRALKRWDRETPEVIRFRAGHFDIQDLVADAEADRMANALAERLITADGAAYKRSLAEQEEFYANQPAVVPSEAQSQVPVELEAYQREVAARPALKVLEIEQQHADTIWVRITGGVILDGGCASGMPQFSIEMLTDNGWVERHPFPVAQMACGMPWAEWNERTVMLHPLRWWVSATSPQGRKELLPGTYRLVLMGANGALMRTEGFALE